MLETLETHIDVLDKGFVNIIGMMGTDSAIVDAARISYGKGTRQVNADRGLIRYLIRHFHWSPVEQVQLQFHVKCPVFVARQFFRHRTMSVNEISARYSIIEDEFYVPDESVLQPQAVGNAQGRSGLLAPPTRQTLLGVIRRAYGAAYGTYQNLLGYTSACSRTPGVARELARMVLPVGIYTEFVFSINLRNLFHLLHLRADSHAQYEIRQYAEALLALIEPRFPLACEAFRDYVHESVTMSRMEIKFLRDLLATTALPATFEEHSAVAERYGMTKREVSEFVSTLSVEMT